MNDNNTQNNNFDNGNEPPVNTVNSQQNKYPGGYPPPPPPFGGPNYGPGPYGPQPYYQSNQNYNFNALFSVKRLAKTYIWFFFISIFIWILGFILVSFSYIFGLVIILIGVVFAIINFVIAIILAVKTSSLNDMYNKEFTAPFILFIVGIFIDLCGLIAAFITLSKIKKITNNSYSKSYNQPPHNNPYGPQYQ